MPVFDQPPTCRRELHIPFPSFGAIAWTQLLGYISLYAAGHFTFEASKVTKNACQSRYVPFHRLTLIKKTAALRFVCLR
jgi:hypothetical protein